MTSVQWLGVLASVLTFDLLAGRGMHSAQHPASNPCASCGRKDRKQNRHKGGGVEEGNLLDAQTPRIVVR